MKIKGARFGSIDKESNYLVESNAHNTGEVILLQDEEGMKAELDHKTRHSTRFAVIVMHPDDKALASACFSTPLVFSVQEAKGLEYENIVLYNFTSKEEQRFREITRGVEHADLQQGPYNELKAETKQRKKVNYIVAEEKRYNERSIVERVNGRYR